MTQMNNQEEQSGKEANNGCPQPPEGYRAHAIDGDKHNNDVPPENAKASEPNENDQAESNRDGAQNPTYKVSDSELNELNAMKRMAYLGIGGAALSFIVGGTFLSIAALVCAVLCYKRTNSYINSYPQSPLNPYVRKRAIASIVAAAVALALNIIAVIIIYPYVMQAVQTGDYSSILGGSASNIAGSSSTWG